MTAKVYVLPTAQTQRDTNRSSGYTGPIVAPNHKGRNTVSSQPKPTLARPIQGDGWPPFGGDAA
ncbi:hypothetical protein P3339_09415 [Microbulbifer sp. MLAF003]|uniref:hypothetical protein n=1 Tax=Microbulbifer sp. MLAF003 TaxID=3032582 RepID=UPI0024AD2829|nr:hypothetical protein [Microbulbifer sp. MLAF003]WHI52959.1 hypothetical protein P3339_09415 [Microbulbifer sp. MLAF003]